MAIRHIEGLPPDALAVEARAIELVGTQAEQMVEDYRNRFGVVVSTDNARELFADYSASLDSRLRYGLAVQRSAAHVADLAFEVITKGATAGAALFTAGGTGAGKTSAIVSRPDGQQALEAAGVVYDSNFNSLSSALAKIETAREARRKVTVIFVHRHPVEAFLEGVIPRARVEGRTVPISGHLRMHKDSRETFLRAQRRLKDDENIAFRVVCNTGHEAEAFQADLDYLKTVKYDDAALFDAIRKGLDEAHDEGKISTALYEFSRGNA